MNAALKMYTGQIFTEKLVKMFRLVFPNLWGAPLDGRRPQASGVHDICEQLQIIICEFLQIIFGTYYL